MTPLLASLILAGGGLDPQIGINVLLNTAPTPAVLNDLREHGTVLDVMPQIKAVTLRAKESDLDAIRAESYVSDASPETRLEMASYTSAKRPLGLAGGASTWALDSINVTDFGSGRVVPYAGEGVYIAVLDTGLPFNWRMYLPEERMATQFARSFTGGGGEKGVVSSNPATWEHDTVGHGFYISSLILGFRYLLDQPSLPPILEGVAPGATIIPIKHGNNNVDTWSWESTIARAILYVTDLKTTGALGSAPLVINISWGGLGEMPLVMGAVDYALSHGVIVVAAAHNFGDSGMAWPGRYAPVISAAASGWVGQLPVDDTTQYLWTVRDVAENDAGAIFIAPFSGRALAGQDLDVAAPGSFLPVPVSTQVGLLQADYSFFVGTSASTPLVAGVAALMLQKNPSLTATQIENILQDSAMVLPPGSRDIRFGVINQGRLFPTVSNQFQGTSLIDLTASWEANATGAGLLQADAALAMTPPP